jgi:hypothetical protein
MAYASPTPYTVLKVRTISKIACMHAWTGRGDVSVCVPHIGTCTRARFLPCPLPLLAATRGRAAVAPSLSSLPKLIPVDQLGSSSPALSRILVLTSSHTCTRSPAFSYARTRKQLLLLLLGLASHVLCCTLVSAVRQDSAVSSFSMLGRLPLLAAQHRGALDRVDDRVAA